MLIIGGILYYLVPVARTVENRKEEKRRQKNVVKVDAEVQVKPSDFFDAQNSYRLSVAEKESHI